jgi:poly(3-hydroxybutyrate) depolymerase
MGTNGYIYVPSGCQSSPVSCRLHVNIHGCLQNYDSIGLMFIERIGMNGWAEENNIITIYPQTANSAGNLFEGCWDLYGYTGSNYCLKSAIQVNAIHSMAQDYVNIVRNIFQ